MMLPLKRVMLQPNVSKLIAKPRKQIIFCTLQIALTTSGVIVAQCWAKLCKMYSNANPNMFLMLPKRCASKQLLLLRSLQRQPQAPLQTILFVITASCFQVNCKYMTVDFYVFTLSCFQQILLTVLFTTIVHP
jgi:hypothetical protein